MGLLKQLPKQVNELSLQNEGKQEFIENVGMETFPAFWKRVGPLKGYFDYEQSLEKELENHKHIWIKKATGLGLTEFFLRWMVWKCLNDPEMKSIDVSVVIITGPRIELAIQLIDRIKDMIRVDLETKNTVCVINGCKIEAFPSHHLASARGLNPKIVFLDEADFFPIGQQQEARDVSERYIAKTDPHIIMVSTPNLPGGLFESIEKEEISLYHRIQLPYVIGIGQIYSKEDIEKAQQSPSFEREYNLKYGYGIGNIFQGLDEIVCEYDIQSIPSELCALDPGFGSSKFGILGIGRKDGIIYIKEAQELERPSLSFAIEKTHDIAKNYKLTLVDSSHPGLIRDLQGKGINCMPVNFAQQDDNKQTLKSKMITEASQAVREKRVRIHKIFRELIAQLRAVRFDSKGGPDKTELNYDLGDCFSMGCNHLKEIRIYSKLVRQEDEDEE